MLCGELGNRDPVRMGDAPFTPIVQALAGKIVARLDRISAYCVDQLSVRWCLHVTGCRRRADKTQAGKCENDGDVQKSVDAHISLCHKQPKGEPGTLSPSPQQPGSLDEE